MFKDLVDSLKSIAARCSVARDASDSSAAPKDAHWITTENGHHVLIRNKDGAVVSFGKASDAIRKMKGEIDGDGRRYAIVGWKGAREEDADAVLTAIQMRDEGKSREEIFDKTAVWWDRKGNMNIELPDLTLKDAGEIIKFYKRRLDEYDAHNKIGISATFGEIMRELPKNSHLIELAQAYPALRDVEIEFYNSKTEPNGHTAVSLLSREGAKLGMIRIGMKTHETSSEMRRTLVHELQHFIQGEEGWENGTTYQKSQLTDDDYLKRKIEYIRSKGELQAEVAAVRATPKYNKDYYTGKHIYPWETEQYIRDDAARKIVRLRKKIEARNDVTVGSMVKALKDWVPGMEVEEVDSSDAASGLEKTDAPVRAQAAMAATGNLVTDHDGVSGLRDRIVNTKGVRLDKSAITPEIDAAMKRWFASEKTKDARALAHVILDTMPWHDRVISVPGVGRVEITSPGIQDILTHTKPGTDASVRAVLQAINAKEILTNGTVFYRETKSGRKMVNIICNATGDGNGFSVISLKQGRPEEEDYRLHAATSVENNKASRTKESDPEWAGLNYTTGALSARIIAQGILENQWESEGDFKSWLKSVVGSSDEGSQPTKVIRNSEGKVAGFYNRKTGRVSLVKGVATPATVAHEISWHATFHWAEKNHPELHKTLMRYAKEAPSGIEQSVRERYDGMNLSPEALLDEIGAERFTREDLSPLLDGVAKKQAEGWFDKVEDAQDEARGAFVKAHTNGGTAGRALPKEEIDRIAALPPKEAVAALVRAMLDGRSLPDKSAATDAANVPCGALVEALRRIADASR